MQRIAGSQTQIQCPNCRQPFVATVEQLIDGSADRNAKMRLLSGRTNNVTCPSCGYSFMIATPLVYHDASKELLVIHMPMELNLPREEQERMIGSMTKAIVNSIPQENRKGYLLMPKSALTLQGMIELILEKDGVTKEMLDARREKLRLAEMFLAQDEQTWETTVIEHDAEIDEEFITMLSASAEAAVANGRPDVAERIMDLREKIIELSTFGQELIARAAEERQVMEEVGRSLEKMGQNATREKLLDMVIEYAKEGKNIHISVAVSLVRPAMDYEFFGLLTSMIEAAADDKEMLINLRETLLKLTAEMDMQSEAIAQRAVSLLQAIMSSPDIDAAITQSIDQIDDTFMAILAANIENAQKTGHPQVAERLTQIYQRIMAFAQQSAPPALQFLNQVMRIRDEGQAIEAFKAQAGVFGEEMGALLEVLITEVGAQGGSDTLNRLMAFRDALADLPDSQPSASESSAPRITLQANPGGAIGNISKFPGPNATPQQPSGDQDRPSGSGIVLPFSAKRGRKKD
jgi:CpXC protein